MSLNLQIINPVNTPSWDKILLTNNAYSFFQSSAWAKVLSKSYGYNPQYFTVIDAGKLQLLIPFMEIKSYLTGRRGVSLPFSDYCNPITSKNVHIENVLPELINHGKESGWKFIEIRGTGKLFEGQPVNSTYLHHNLDISTNEKEIFSKVRPSTKRNIKKAVREGIGVKILHSFESVEEFYRLHCITRKRHGLPPQPFYFFKNIYKDVISKKLGAVILAYYKETLVAGAIYLHIGEKVIYKYGASDKKYQNLRANNLVMWEAIKWYSGHGYKSFSFGRTDIENKGLVQFKSGWGAKEEHLKYYKYDLKKNAFISTKPHNLRVCTKFFNNMPAPLLKLVGSLVYKHLG